MSSSLLPLSPGGRRYGRYRDNPYHPARKLLEVRLPSLALLPPRASTSQWMGSIRDQGQEGSCTGQMGGEVRDWVYRKLFLFEKDKSIPASSFKASASFVYKNNLIADGDLGQDNGSSIHQSFITLNQKGACLESVEPYSDSDFSTAPSAAQYANALIYKGGPYHYLPTLAEIKASIASGFAVGFGIDVFESFEGDQLSSTGFMPLPASTEQILGGHAQLGLDYDDEIQPPDRSWTGAVFVQNSWGSSWGMSASGRTDRGCYWMPYAYFAEHVSDAWMMHLGPAWK